MAKREPLQLARAVAVNSVNNVKTKIHMKKNIIVSPEMTSYVNRSVTGDVYIPLSRVLDTFNPESSLDERGMRTPTYDKNGSLGVDISSDFTKNGFDCFEFVRDNSASEAERHANKKYIDAQFRASVEVSDPNSNDTNSGA